MYYTSRLLHCCHSDRQLPPSYKSECQYPTPSHCPTSSPSLRQQWPLFKNPPVLQGQLHITHNMCDPARPSKLPNMFDQQSSSGSSPGASSYNHVQFRCEHQFFWMKNSVSLHANSMVIKAPFHVYWSNLRPIQQVGHVAAYPMQAARLSDICSLMGAA